ncbi:uncharacterized protein LOC142568562 [Dermacentor variabilis]|uniref:uncharacterized protein LOC142568562 n=1 Tax=Dermacentor variabilis TaxID=34621 RepID=UPI003F5CA593
MHLWKHAELVLRITASLIQILWCMMQQKKAIVLEGKTLHAKQEFTTPARLSILLSATNGTEASTQVVHTEMSHKVARTDRNWKRDCGFRGFEFLKEKQEALQDLCGVTLQVFCLLLNMLPPPRYRCNAMSSEDKLCLFLAKLRLRITYSALGAVFSVTATTASTVLRETLGILSIALKNWVFMPSREIIKLSLPDPFKENYPNCTLIIDCTEIRIETPSNPDCQHMLYSHYKGGYTLKVLVGIIPNGMISFISKVYGGRHIDSFITQDSGFLQLLKPGDLILSDKGFPNIRTTIEGSGAVLLMPPFNSGRGQLSAYDMEIIYKIASLRIHVERVIQRLKIYRILRNRVPLRLVPHMNKVISVCAALVNMQNDTFDESSRDPKWWDNGHSLPIWAANQLHGGSMMRPGGDVAIRGVTAHYAQRYDPPFNFTDRVISWFLHPPANCVFFYYEEPDATGHEYGSCRLSRVRASSKSTPCW